MPALNPVRYQKVFGSTFVKDYAEHPLLIVGEDTWTRGDLAKLGIVQARACSILTGIAKSLKVRSLKEFYERTSPYTLSEFACGVTTLYVIFAIFLESDLDPDSWYQAGRERALVTFIALKHRELKARARTKAHEKSRQRRIGRQQHEAAVKPLLQRGV